MAGADAPPPLLLRNHPDSYGSVTGTPEEILTHLYSVPVLVVYDERVRRSAEASHVQ